MVKVDITVIGEIQMTKHRFYAHVCLHVLMCVSLCTHIGQRSTLIIFLILSFPLSLSFF